MTSTTFGPLNQATTTFEAVHAASQDALLLESGDFLLLESGDKLLLEF